VVEDMLVDDGVVVEDVSEEMLVLWVAWVFV
jgi:hypothetical protein